ncbi:L-ascorbate metabolism protein UlaG (beta-lactamase superfamily) [Planomicrobium koreense]|uniref:L-ascorbate metabolism protein UlaG (Beta-lactamase superfamily) n=1 Tax=Planococcus koreensis TaxID=112331 RepID=A0A7W8FS98_9BACL|nr:MBL fold metallo-hydrolase [Planococcus koreensis]MBB5178796.1 L-ascorbate metabolism protein UlaG (beta-lactamase superfamily) [Planococcus koreensis]
MNIQQIRSATLVINYAGKKFLIDPFLAEKGAYPPFPNAARQDQNNPLDSLTVPINEIINGIDAVIVTHLHLDHWDDAAKEALPKDIKLFVQNEEDAEEVRSSNFQNVGVLQEDTIFEGIQLIKTKGEHGRGEILNLMGVVSGVVFKHQDEKTVYVAGDTVWYDGVQEAINVHKPEVIVVNAGANQFLEGGSIVMDKEDVYEVYQAAPEATIISVHMESANHWGLSKEDLKSFAAEKGFSSKLFVPEDGESYTF